MKTAGIERSKMKKQEQSGNYKRNGPARKEQKTRKQENVLEDKKKKKKKCVSRLQHSYNYLSVYYIWL